MREAIRQCALELGFDDCRFATTQPPASSARFLAWLDAQHHGEMAYLARNADKRVDLQRVLPGARSVICLAASYAPRHECRVSSDVTPVLPPYHAVIARYARFDDYHDVLGERLKTLSAQVNQIGGEGTRSLWYVDTGPVLERDLAQRAGVGFIGKHTNLISR